MTNTDPTELSDEILATAVQKGDNASFDELMRRFEEKLVRYGRRFLAREEDIEDSVQDVFLRAYTNIQSYDSKYRFSPWIYRIAHNVFVNVLRKNSHRSFTFIDFDTFISPLSFGESKEELDTKEVVKKELEAGLKNIPPKYREILILHYFEELSYDEIAEVLHIPIGTVGVRLRRGREALKKTVKDIDELQHYGT